MKIILNNRTEEFKQDKLSITELLGLKNFTFRLIVVRINGELVKRPQYSDIYIKDGDNVMVLHMMSGG
ncbi:sulfur carrier protein ThiS [Bacteroidota bacterium]